jgi:hypothetical protein
VQQSAVVSQYSPLMAHWTQVFSVPHSMSRGPPWQQSALLEQFSSSFLHTGTQDVTAIAASPEVMAHSKPGQHFGLPRGDIEQVVFEQHMSS